MNDSVKTPRPFLTERAMVISLIVVLLGSVAFDSRGDDESGFLRPGSALNEVGGTWGQRFLVPGQSFVNMDISLDNLTDEVVTIRSVAPVWAYGRKVAIVSNLRIGTRNSRLSAANFYRRDPPSELVGGNCQQQELHDVIGYRIQPGEDAVLAATVDVKTKGRFHIDGWLVTYETQGDLFRQTNRSGVAGRSGDRRIPSLGKSECGGEPLWPGAGS